MILDIVLFDIVKKELRRQFPRRSFSDKDIWAVSVAIVIKIKEVVSVFPEKY